MVDRLLPRRLDNSFGGQKIALWLFGLIVAVRILQSLFILFNGPAVVRGADGIPLDSYPPGAAQTILALFALSAVSRLFLYLLCALVLVRYRSAVPFMFLFVGLSYLAGQLALQLVPIVRTGTPPGPIVNQVLFALTIAGLALSLWKRRSAGEGPPAEPTFH
jgi:hypothetical protein